MITSEYIEPSGDKVTWANGQVIHTETVIYGTTIYSVNGDAVSQYEQVGFKNYEATDYYTGRIYQDLPKREADRLALQIAQSCAYESMEAKQWKL